jgi:hypothetical protein
MTIYVTYTPHKGNVWGKCIMDQNMTLDQTKAAIEATKEECRTLGITCNFQTGNELLGNFLAEIEAARRA